MRLVSLDRRRERLHVELSLCEGRVRTDRAIQRDDDCEQDERRGASPANAQTNTPNNPDFCRGASGDGPANSPPTEVPFRAGRTLLRLTRQTLRVAQDIAPRLSRAQTPQRPMKWTLRAPYGGRTIPVYRVAVRLGTRSPSQGVSDE